MPDLNRFIKNGNYYYFGDAPRHISGIVLNKNSIALNTVGQTEQLMATINPQGAIEKDIVWNSSNTSIATVSQTGLVTCVTPGECTITATCGGYSASCSVVVPRQIDFLLVGGGGSGGWCYSGGGGAGGVVQCNNYGISPGSYGVTIGAGGISSCSTTCMRGTNGGNSTFNGLTAYGGGGGGGSKTTGLAGGSGGGGGYMGGTSGYAGGGSGCVGQGNSGGCGFCYAGGGGGGAGGAGCIASSYCCGGVGGIGIQSDIRGTTDWYAGGGSGYSGYDRSTPASSGGTPSCNNACSNATIYGAGGGGTSSYAYGKGCQGIFVVRYPQSCGYSISGGYQCSYGAYCIHIFTSDGTLTVN